MEPQPKNTLQLGLCLAGAVSAGAYTAGVIDYLLEALEEWETRRGQPGVPTHKVKIPAMGGASAGGMTGILTAAAIQSRIVPVSKHEDDILKEQPQNSLYHTWVDLLDKDMFMRMLQNDDIDDTVYSLLNSKFIEEIADRALRVDQSQRVVRPYIDDHLRVFTTLTNLKGFSYNVTFSGRGEENSHYMTRHSDFAAFVLNKSEADYLEDGWMPLDFNKPLNVQVAKEAAMATGAFPVGLRARRIERKAKYLNELSWLGDITKKWPIVHEPDTTLCIDGGLINNEPFYKVGEMLEEILKCEAGNPSEFEVNETADGFESTMIMIDPFPSKRPEKFEIKDSLTQVMKQTVGAMVSQMRIKPESLEKVQDKENLSQFIVAPSRVVEGTRIEGETAIACGFLGGFGGFIDKEFRIHDFHLGRGNCEKFLRDHFTVPKDTANPIFAKGYRDMDTSKFLSQDGSRLQIIPIFKERTDKMYMPIFKHGQDWPVRTEKEIDRFEGPIRRRAGKIIMNIGNYGWFQNILIGIGNRVVLRSKVGNSVLNAIKDSMREWRLLP